MTLLRQFAGLLAAKSGYMASPIKRSTVADGRGPSFPSKDSMTVAARLTAELDQAISIARGFYLGDDPGEWSDIDIDSTAEDVAESSGVDCSELKLFLVSERNSRRLGRR